jgi:hypothetical protein
MMADPHPVSLSDEQFTIVVDTAKLLPPRLRPQFLCDVMNLLARDPLVTNGAVSKAINLTLRSLQVTG